MVVTFCNLKFQLISPAPSELYCVPKFDTETITMEFNLHCALNNAERDRTLLLEETTEMAKSLISAISSSGCFQEYRSCYSSVG